MENLLAGLSLMFFDLEIVTKLNNENPVLVFSVACSIVGAIAVVLDFALYYLRGRSLLDLKHGKQTFFFLIALSRLSLISRSRRYACVSSTQVVAATGVRLFQG